MFRKPSLAETVEKKLLEYRDRGFYRLHAYAIMPDHIHLILTPGETTSLEKADQLIKGGSSHEIGVAVGSKFPLWQVSFTEHQIRDHNDFASHVRYIEMNPVRGKLVDKASEYLFSSARGKFTLDGWPAASGAEAHDVFAGSLRRG